MTRVQLISLILAYVAANLSSSFILRGSGGVLDAVGPNRVREDINCDARMNAFAIWAENSVASVLMAPALSLDRTKSVSSFVAADSLMKP